MCVVWYVTVCLFLMIVRYGSYDILVCTAAAAAVGTRVCSLLLLPLRCSSVSQLILCLFKNSVKKKYVGCASSINFNESSILVLASGVSLHAAPRTQ